jgi:hypothetical protein
MKNLAASKRLVLVAFLSGQLFAADYKPYEVANITVEQWQAISYAIPSPRLCTLHDCLHDNDKRT